MQQAWDALGLARDLAAAEAVELRRSLGEQLPHKHKAVADDLAKIDAAIDALQGVLAHPAPCRFEPDGCNDNECPCRTATRPAAEPPHEFKELRSNWGTSNGSICADCGENFRSQHAARFHTCEVKAATQPAPVVRSIAERGEADQLGLPDEKIRGEAAARCSTNGSANTFLAGARYALKEVGMSKGGDQVWYAQQKGLRSAPLAAPLTITREMAHAASEEWDVWAAENRGTYECFEAVLRAGLCANKTTTVTQPTDEQIAALAWRIGMGPAIVAGADVVGFAHAVLTLQPADQEGLPTLGELQAMNDEQALSIKALRSQIDQMAKQTVAEPVTPAPSRRP